MSSPPVPGTPPGPSPERILQLARGYLASKYLFEASELRLFEKLGAGAKSLSSLSRELGVPERSTRILVDAVAALGLLEKTPDGAYRNAPESLAFLSGSTPSDLNPILRMWNRLEYGAFGGLGGALRHRSGGGAWTVSPEDQALFSAGVEALTRPLADRLSRAYDFSAHRSLIDLGGGTGSFLIPIAARFPQVSCTLFELPQTAAVARTRIASETGAGQPASSRIQVVEGDLLKDPIPRGHDAFLVSNVLHVFSPEHVRELLGSIRRSAPSGARLLLVDFWTAEDHLSPVAAALMAGVFFMRSGEGDVYSLEEIREWLGATGWKFRERVPLVGPQSLVVAES